MYLHTYIVIYIYIHIYIYISTSSVPAPYCTSSPQNTHAHTDTYVYIPMMYTCINLYMFIYMYVYTYQHVKRACTLRYVITIAQRMHVATRECRAKGKFSKHIMPLDLLCQMTIALTFENFLHRWARRAKDAQTNVAE